MLVNSPLAHHSTLCLSQQLTVLHAREVLDLVLGQKLAKIVDLHVHSFGDLAHFCLSGSFPVYFPFGGHFSGDVKLLYIPTNHNVVAIGVKEFNLE
jgi:hypothetical protein